MWEAANYRVAFYRPAYWAYRVQQLELGPKCIKIGKVSDKALKETVNDLVTNPVYRRNATKVAEQMHNAHPVDNFSNFIKSMADKI